MRSRPMRVSEFALSLALLLPAAEVHCLVHHPSSALRPALHLHAAKMMALETQSASQQQKPQQVDLASVGFLFGASALWGTYPSTIKCFFNSPGSPISPGEVTLLRFIVMAAVSMVVYGLTSGDAEERAASECLLEDGECTLDAPWTEQLERRAVSYTHLTLPTKA